MELLPCPDISVRSGKHEVWIGIPPIFWEAGNFLALPWGISCRGWFMDISTLAKMYVNAVKDDKIEAKVLTKLPELVTCQDWKKVEIVGKVDYVSPITKIVYDGIIVKYDGGLYYVKKKVVDTLGHFDRKFLKVNRVIEVIP